MLKANINRHAGGGWEDWSDYVLPLPDLRVESSGSAYTGVANLTFTNPPATPLKDWGLQIEDVPAVTRYTDDFHRPDSTDIAVGAPPGFSTWNAGAYPCIRGETLTAETVAEGGNGNGYACLTPELTPVRAGGVFSFDAGGSLGDADTAVTIDCSDMGPGMQPGIHLRVSAVGYNLVLWDRGAGNLDGHLYGTFAVPLVAAVEYEWWIDYLGDYLRVHLPDGTEHMVGNGQIGLRLGQYMFWQAIFTDGVGARPRWHSVNYDLPSGGES